MKIIQESISIRVQSLTACSILELDGKSRVRLSIVAEEVIATRTDLCYLQEDQAKSMAHFTKDLATLQEFCTGSLISLWA